MDRGQSWRGRGRERDRKKREEEERLFFIFFSCAEESALFFTSTSFSLRHTAKFLVTDLIGGTGV